KLILIFGLCFIFIYCKDQKPLGQDKVNLIGANTEADSVKETKLINELKSYLSNTYDSGFLTRNSWKLFGDYINNGYPIPTSKIDERMVKIPNNNGMPEEKFVYFYKADFDDIFNNLSCNDDFKGIRIYLRKCNPNLKKSDGITEHPYRNEYVVFLKGVCKHTESSNPNTIYDYGDVCPPNCNKMRYDTDWIAKSNRDENASKDGEIK
ncbi:MAG TPA: hypothetical protein PLC44_10785, partial [Saprospiraceae bacterium]|nr:hypothetical protein [Saprospiraceae bacterium]HNG70153.1 hypothetical protein [Saprospiraceae bacterium]